jgi:adenine-specific DNA-methyltransferase
MSRGAHRYLVAGEVEGVPAAYKCRVRSPWWQVPLVPVADLLLTYMNADTPRLTTNTARVRHLNSVHGVYLNEATAALGRELLPLASLNSLTLLGAELVGRAYGGDAQTRAPRSGPVAGAHPCPGGSRRTGAAGSARCGAGGAAPRKPARRGPPGR